MSLIHLNYLSLLHNLLQIDIDIQPKWQNYWLRGKRPVELYQAIADAIINKPYADMPDYFTKHDGTIIYHPNHDTAHAARQAINTGFFLDLIKLYGQPSQKLAAESFSEEEIAALELAGFLFRAARTNELSGEQDMQNAVRSAELFKCLALELGFNAQLVSSIYHCIAYTYTQLSEQDTSALHEGFIGEKLIQNDKFNLAKKILHLSHHSDLVRCYENKNKIAEPNKSNLLALISPDKVDVVAQTALDFSRASCEKTGTFYFTHNASDDTRTPPLHLKVEATQQVEKTFAALNDLKEQFKNILKNHNTADSQTRLKQIQENNVAFKLLGKTEADDEAAKTIQRHYRKKRAYQLTQQAVGTNPKEVSKSNLHHLCLALQEGLGLSQKEKTQKGEAFLTAEEKPLFDYLMNEFPWTLKHITAHYPEIHWDNDRLKSLHQRRREKQNIHLWATSDFEGRSDNIFFTVGSPNGWPAYFLQATKGHEIRIPLRPFLQSTSGRPTDQLTGLWLGSSWCAFPVQGRTETQFGTTKRQVNFVQSDVSSPFIQPDNYKKYVYQQQNGKTLSRQVGFQEETVTDAELLPFLVYQVLLELRCLDPDLRKRCLNLSDKALIEACVDALFEQRNFEALLPAGLSLDDPRIEIKPFNHNLTAVSIYKQRMFKVLTMYSDNDLPELSRLLDEGAPIDMDLGNGVTPFAFALARGRMDLCSILVKKGANTQVQADGNPLWLNAVAQQCHMLVDLILQTGVLDKRASSIKQHIDPLALDGAVLLAIKNADHEMLTIFKRHGFDFSSCSHRILTELAKLSEMDALNMLQYLRQEHFSFKSDNVKNQDYDYEAMQIVIEKGKTNLLAELINLGLNIYYQPASTHENLTDYALRLNQYNAATLLLKRGVESKNISPPAQQTAKSVHLIIQDPEKQHILVGKSRRADNSINPTLQSLTLTTAALSRKQIDEALFTAFGIRLHDADVHTLYEDDLVSSLLINLKQEVKPTSTQNWADCQWLPMHHIDKADKVTQAALQPQDKMLRAELIQNQQRLIEAVKANDLVLVKQLLTQGRISDTHMIALCTACDTNTPNLAIINELINYGYDINSVYQINDEPMTPLMLGIFHRQPELISYLIARGANINQEVGPYVITPAFLAAELNQLDTLTLLQQHGANFTNVLAYASYKRCSNAVFDYLLEHSSLKGEYGGLAPLIFATKQKNKDRIKSLLGKGADLKVRDPYTNLTAEEMLREKSLLDYNLVKNERLDWYALQKKIKTYLSFTNQINNPKLDERITEEYQMEILDENSESTLGHFANQLLRDIGLDPKTQTLKIAIAHEGNLPVFPCFGLSTPVIAIHQKFLKQDKATYQQLCFALHVELARLKGSSNGMKHLELEEQLPFDKQVLEQHPEYLESAMQYLKYANTWTSSFSDKHFIWPKPCYETNAPGVPFYRYYFFGERIKYITLLSNSLRNQAIEPQMTTLSPALKSAVSELKKVVYYSLFLTLESYDKKAAYLMEQLATLKDELLPFELSEIPSARLKEFCAHINALLQGDDKQFNKELFIDQLLIKALDLNIPGYAYIYRNIVQTAELTINKDSFHDLPPLGHFKILQEEIHTLLQANDWEQGKMAVESIYSLYPKLAKHHAYMEPQHYMYDYMRDYGQLPTNRQLCSSIGRHIAWDVLYTPSAIQKLLQWLKESKDEHLWQVMWMMGIVTNHSLYNYLPQMELKQLPNLKVDQLETQTKIPMPLLPADGIHLNNYPQDLKTNIQGYFAQMPIKSPAVTDDLAACHEFIERNHERLSYFINKRNESDLVIHELIDRLSELAYQGENGENFIRHFFLDYDGLGLKSLLDYYSHLEKNSPFVQFFLTHRHLFTPYEITHFIFTNTHIAEQVSFEQWVDMLRIKKTNKLEQLIGIMRYLYACTGSSSDLLCAHLVQHVFGRLAENSMPIFATQTVQFLEALSALQTPMGTLIQSFSEVAKKLHWQDLSHCDLDLNQCISLYRLFDTHFAFPSTLYQEQFGQLILTKFKSVQDNDRRLALLESLLFQQESERFLPLNDKAFLRSLAKEWAQCIVKKIGQDDNTNEYYQRIKTIIDKTYANTPLHLDRVCLLDELTNQAMTQYPVSSYIGSLIEPEQYSDSSGHDLTGLSHLTPVFSSFSKKTQDKEKILDFLASPLSAQSLDALTKYIDNHPEKYRILESLNFNNGEKSDISRAINGPMLRYILSLLHKQFWDLQLTERCILLDSLIITPKEETSDQSHEQAYWNGFNYVSKRLFPNAQNPQSDDHFAYAILTSYLKTAEAHERQFLLAGLLAATNESSGNNSIGHKFAVLCENLGPAYVKLAQAIHSHPNSPPDIKNELEHVKSNAAPPKRWAAWRLIKSVLPQEQFQKIHHLGELLGSASFNLAFSLKTNENDPLVLLLLRENAAENAEKGFQHLQRTIQDCTHPIVASSRALFVNTIKEAEVMSHAEMDHDLAKKKHAIAVGCYNGTKIDVNVGSPFVVHFKACDLKENGPGYRVLSLVPGQEFNKLPNDSLNEKQIRKAIATSVMKKELSLIFSGKEFDCDRHGNQLRAKVVNNDIFLGLYDFGEMSLAPLTDKEIVSLSDLVRELPAAFKKNNSASINELFQKHIQNALAKNEPSRHLIRVNKALLALEDFRKELNQNDLMSIFTEVVKKFHPQLQKAFVDGATKEMTYLEKGLYFFKAAFSKDGEENKINPLPCTLL